MSYLQQFFYQIHGPDAGPKLVFLHGVMGFGLNWRRVAKAFENEYQVLTYDQRGHGRSMRPSVGYGPEDYAHDLGKILDELGWQKIALVGHSMGGRIAFHFAHEYPERLTHLVIEDIGPAMNAAGAGFVLNLLNAVPVPFRDKRAAKEYFEGEFLQKFADVPHKEGLAAFLHANITENESKQGVWRFYESGIRESIEQGRAQERWNEIEDLRMPTLLVRGEQSRDLPQDIFAKMLNINPRIKGVEIAGAGHWVHSDKPDEFIEVVRNFLKSPTAASSTV